MSPLFIENDIKIAKETGNCQIHLISHTQVLYTPIYKPTTYFYKPITYFTHFWVPVCFKSSKFEAGKKAKK